jgi:hypothetical protein
MSDALSASEQSRLQKQKTVLKKAYLREQALRIALEKQLSGREQEVERLCDELGQLSTSGLSCNGNGIHLSSSLHSSNEVRCVRRYLKMKN